MTSDDPWSRAWRHAREQRAADEPRRRAFRGAIDAVRRQGERDPVAIRAALVPALAERGVTDPAPEELDFAADAVASPTRAAAKLGLRAIEALGATIGTFREMATYRLPRWAEYPGGVPQLPEERLDAADPVVTIELAAAELTSGRPTITRLIAEVRDQSTEEEEQTRPVDVWLSLISEAGVGVHIGDSQIGEITGPEVRAIRAGIDRWGKGAGTLGIHGHLLGSTPDTAHLEMWI